jgi:hypothetical protein
VPVFLFLLTYQCSDGQSLSAHFFFGGCGAESGSHPGELETSNSGASACGGAGLLDFAMGAAAGFALAPAEAAAAFAADTGGLLAGTAVLAGVADTGFGGAVAGFAGTAAFAAAAGFALPSASAALPRPSACSTEARKSTSMRSGDPEEYSAWNITFQDWQIIRSRMIGS